MKRNYGVMDSVPPEWPDRGQSKTREVFEIYPGLALQGPPLLLLFLPRHFYFYFLFFVPSTENAISFSGCHRFQRSGPRGCECIYLLRTKHSRNYSVLIPVSLCRVRRHWQLEKKKRRRSGVNGALSHPLLFPDCRACPQKRRVRARCITPYINFLLWSSFNEVRSIYSVRLSFWVNMESPHNCQPRQFVQFRLVRCRMPDEVACYYEY